MKVPETLSVAFGSAFEKCIAQFSVDQGLLPDLAALQSRRFVARSIIPHVTKLSSLFNRDEKDQGSGLTPYWKQSSNPAHLRMAYFLYFMPSNLFRVASVWSELSRLGFQWQPKTLKAVEFGAGPASGACGIAAGQTYGGTPLPKEGNWALIEQDQSILNLGAQWAETYFSHVGVKDWTARPFHQKIDPLRGFLPPRAPQFNLWLMSYYLNETQSDSQQLAATLLRDWSNHLEDEGLIILVEPALKLQSRRLLELRKALLIEQEKRKVDWLQVLLPCLGHQACGALANPEDWCHEEVSWWRPPYFRKIDQMAGLDRKTLPFSYLVLIKTRRSREEILPALAGSSEATRHRLVSPAHREGREFEFYLCGQEGKRKARSRLHEPAQETTEVSAGEILEKNSEGFERGDILLRSDIRGDRNSGRIDSYQKKI